MLIQYDSDYNFGIPSFPWINGRDFAGIVVKAGKAVSRVKLGDIVNCPPLNVCIGGPSTDYRDSRKAAYQEYLITTDFNVAKLPANLSPNTGAALGVAFVSAIIALGISLGFNFTKTEIGPQGPDLLQAIRGVPLETIPEDVRTECLKSIDNTERPQSGEWFAVWGG